jgi:hypothetical protein
MIEDRATRDRRDPKRTFWIKPRVMRLHAGEAENHPGDTHADGTATFS